MTDEQIQELLSTLSEKEAKELLHKCFWIIEGEWGDLGGAQGVVDFIKE